METLLVKRMGGKIMIGFLSLLVGALYLGPPLLIAAHMAERGQPFVLSFESYRNDLTYFTWAREIYDGHFPPRDPFSDHPRSILVNVLPASIMAGFIALAGGRVVPAYLGALFVFSQINFLLFYRLGRCLFRVRVWAICFALLAVLTPIALRILNFDGTA